VSRTQEDWEIGIPETGHCGTCEHNYNDGVCCHAIGDYPEVNKWCNNYIEGSGDAKANAPPCPGYLLKVIPC
jgi:hypothetical protein